jgi:hypothetical protein
MLTKIVSRWIANRAFKEAKLREKNIGYHIQLLNKLNKNWINSCVLVEMSSVWKKFGLEAIGLNYFTIGLPARNLSSRFIPESPYFQSWFGAYLVKFDESREWQINDHFRLAVADQIEWLKMYGDPNPKAIIDFDNISHLGKIDLPNNYKANLFKGFIKSHVDVGEAKRPWMFPLLISAFSYHMQKNNPKVKIGAKTFNPRWNPKYPLRSYQDITLQGYVAIAEISPYIKTVIYANGAIFKDVSGKENNYFHHIENELIALIKNVQILKS